MHYAKQTYYSRIRRDSICNTFQEPIITSVIDVKKIAAWGESGFPARFLGPTQTPSQPEGYGIKASNICVNNRCFNDPRFPEFHQAGHETNETHEVSVGNNPLSKNLLQAVAFRADGSTSPTASFKLDRIGAFVHSMTGGSIAEAAIHASTSSGPGTKLFDLDPLLNDEENVDYFVAPPRRAGAESEHQILHRVQRRRRQ